MKNTNLIIGKINSGKTQGIMFNEVKSLIANRKNLIILDNKEEYFKTFKNSLDENGYNTMVFNLKNTSRSNSFNPLLLPYKYYKQNDKDKAVELISELASEIFKTNNADVDPFWDNSAANYFTSLTLILFKEAQEEEINLGSIQIMLNMGENFVDNIRIMDKYFKNLNVLDSIYITGSAIVYAPTETRGSIISVMKQKLNAYCMREQLLNNLAGNEINFDNINGATAIFVISNNSISGLANILINQVVNYSIDNNLDFTFVLDNICDMKRLLKLDTLLDYKIKTYVLARDEEMLKEIYGNYITTKFEFVIDSVQSTNLISIGFSTDYPISRDNKPKYFNFEEFVRSNELI